MEEHELSDILLEQRNSKNSTVVKIKRLLVIAILLILLFVVVLLIMKFINKSDEQPQNRLTQTMLEESANIPNTTITHIEESPVLEQTEEIAEENITEEDSIIPTQITVIDEPQISKPPITEIEQPNITPVTPPKQNTTVKNDVKNGWYIQVSSSSNAPAKSFLDNIAKKGYQHHQYKTTVNSKQVIKVLVGPYASDKAARIALLDVKSDISKDAFVYQVK
ncbi:MAG: SPOR domain-containing protein [Campylobacteraceae bacterium]|jgi:DedD protein|nr:SPOR domain-containing protein [Campylobacteraceae bacterium]